MLDDVMKGKLKNLQHEMDVVLDDLMPDVGDDDFLDLKRCN